MTKLAESSGIVIYETGNKLFISKRPATWTTVFLFVTGLLALILLVNGGIQFFAIKNQDTGLSKTGLILTGMGVLVALIFWSVRSYHKRIRAIPLNQLKNIAIIDFESNSLLDTHHKLLSPLNQLWLMRKMQLSSSSPELIIAWDRGSLSIVKGNPFSGGIAPIERVLQSKGIRGTANG